MEKKPKSTEKKEMHISITHISQNKSMCSINVPCIYNLFSSYLLVKFKLVYFSVLFDHSLCCSILLSFFLSWQITIWPCGVQCECVITIQFLPANAS